MKGYLVWLALCVASMAYGAGVIRIGEPRPGVRPIREDPAPASQPRYRSEREPDPAPEAPAPAPVSQPAPVVPQARTLLRVESAPFRRWVSSKGTGARARLIEVTDVGAVLLLADTIERMSVTREQLSPEDVAYLDNTLAMEALLRRAQEVGASEYAAKLLSSALEDYPDAPQIEAAGKLLATYETAVDRERRAKGLIRIDGQWLPKPHAEASLLTQELQDALADPRPDRTVARLKAALAKHPTAANRRSVELVLQRLEASAMPPVTEPEVSVPSADTGSLEHVAAADDPGPTPVEESEGEGSVGPELEAAPESPSVMGWSGLAWWLLPPLALLGVGRALGASAQGAREWESHGPHARRAASVDGGPVLAPASIPNVIAIFWLIALPLGWLLYAIVM